MNMSKLPDNGGEAKVWAVPEIKADSSRNLTHTDTSLSPRERKAVEEKVNKLKHSAYQEGFEKGRREGAIRGQQQLDQTAQSVANVMDAMSAPLQRMEEQLESELVKLAVAIAKQIVRRELKTDPRQVVAVVREALAIIPSAAQHIRVYLCPDDAALVRKLIPASGGDRSWEVVDDPLLSQGSCRVESDSATVDASFEARIAAIAAELLGSERADD
ncbi:hypothetical protein Tel_05655 [Candidatus Tenderia electrophaga]|jgi:flagellar assembly protein FliH|uniref:Flagellar assembly protein FliH n=1 Tax=Candidatus Tenderia electrophaga TaxID=1748243 RepID=A0A0S2TC50_9GAMM|nr:hypothetical protein Tel_05655 [Candidatus Tenderia electrophaga]